MVLRAGLATQLLAVPFAAVVLVHYLPRARAIRSASPRILATLGCIGLATPLAATAAAKSLDHVAAPFVAATPAGTSAGGCDLERLNLLPRAKLFAPFDLGPEILARTPDSVVMAPYHRNQAKMREIFDAFAGPLGRARAIVRANRVDYLVACTDDGRLGVYAAAGQGNLADLLLAGRAPDWLEPVPDFEQGALKVYRIN